jgi:multidrug resistance protein, MATE family
MLQGQNFKDHLRKNFLLAFPVMLGHLGHVMVGVADSIMVGQLGSAQLAAVSLANGLFMVLLAFSIGFSSAITPLVALAEGEQDQPKAAQFFNHGFMLNAVLGIVFSLFFFIGAPLIKFLNQPEDVVALTIPYFQIISLSLIPFMFFQSSKQFAEGLSKTRQAMYIIVFSNLLNIFFNYLLIFGKAGLPALGLMGAGWATLGSRVFMAMLMNAYVFLNLIYRPYIYFFQLKHFYKNTFRRIVSIGLPTGFQYIFEVGAFSMAVVFMGWLGENEQAAHQIAINLASISYMLAAGIAAAATVRVGNQLGRRDKDTLRAAGFTSYLMSIALMAIAAIIFITGRYFLARLYIDDEVVIELAAQLLVIAAFFQVSDGIQVIGLGALRGMADVKIPTIITLIAYWILGLPIGYLLAFKLGYGAHGIWIGLLTGLTVAAILLSARFNVVSKRIIK